MFLTAVVFLLIFKLFLAGKDASSYLLKNKIATGDLINNRIKRWHRDGVVIDVLNTLSVAYIFGNEWWKIFFVSLIIRLSVYDLAFNHWGGLDIKHLGSTAWADQQFVKVFGEDGAVRKSIFFFIILILFVITHYVFL